MTFRSLMEGRQVSSFRFPVSGRTCREVTCNMKYHGGSEVSRWISVRSWVTSLGSDSRLSTYGLGKNTHDGGGE
jgi:hypothetical protein